MTTIPTAQRDDDRPGLDRDAVVRQREADGVEEPEEALAEAEAEDEPDDGGDTPITSASTMTEPSTWRREAPSVRSVANSRVRWAIVIESEFAITNAPTKSAMPPKASRKVCRMRDEAVRVLGVALRLRVAALDLRARRQDRLDLRRRASPARRPAFAATRIWSSLPTLPNSRCAVGRSKPASVAPPIVSTAPNLTRPEMRNVSTGALGLDADRLPGREVLLRRGRRVDHDLAGLRPGAARRA